MGSARFTFDDVEGEIVPLSTNCNRNAPEVVIQSCGSQVRTMVSHLSYLALAAQLLLVNCYDLTRVTFSIAEFKGDEYRRLIEPMPQFEAVTEVSGSSQVSVPCTTATFLGSDALPNLRHICALKSPHALPNTTLSMYLPARYI